MNAGDNHFIMAKIFLAIIFSLSAFCCFSQTRSPIDTATTPVGFLKSFYTIYITDMAIGNSLNSSDSLAKKYCKGIVT